MSLSALAFGAALVVAPAAAEPATITFTFPEAAAEGVVRVALFDSAEAYAGRGAPVRVAQIAAAEAARGVTFEGLPAGDYALKVHHDLNGDGEMNANPFGLPVEPYGFSNNAVGAMGPAPWDRARFTASGAVSQAITLR